MSARGESVPELAELLREIAATIEAGTAGDKQADILRRIADSAEGGKTDYVLKLHQRRGRAKGGLTGLNNRIVMAQAIADFRAINGGPLADAYEALSGKFHVGPEALKKVWQEMGPLIKMSEPAKSTALYFKRLEAQGRVTVRRVKRT